MPREWLRPVHTENVPTYDDRICRWTYQAIPGELYYEIKVRPCADFPKLNDGVKDLPRYILTLRRLQLAEFEESERPKSVYSVAKAFKADRGEVIGEDRTRNVRAAVLKMRKKLLTRVKRERGDAPVKTSPSQPVKTARFKFADEFDSSLA